MSKNTLNLEKILENGTKIIKKAGVMTLPYFEQYQQAGINTHDSNIDIDIKSDNSPVTNADKETELWIRKELESLYPDFGIIGEEFGINIAHTEYSWVIDPIDGTRSFIHGVPLYTNLLGLIHTETRTPIAGFVYAPVTKELVYAATGMGAWYNDNPAKVSPITRIEDATVVSYDWQAVYKKSKNLIDINNQANTVRTWGDGFAYIMLVSGRAHIIIDPQMHMWDIMPAYPIMKEAGCKVDSWNKQGMDWFSNDIDVISSVSSELLDYVQKNV